MLIDTAFIRYIHRVKDGLNIETHIHICAAFTASTNLIKYYKFLIYCFSVYYHTGF